MKKKVGEVWHSFSTKRGINQEVGANRDDHTKWSKSDRERPMPYDITYMWNLQYDANELIYKTETDSQT